jgi:tRNA(Arg) A34 adenosine deaminase TadA
LAVDYLAMNNGKQDRRFMEAAIGAAEVAEENGDVPIGAVIVYENRLPTRRPTPR